MCVGMFVHTWSPEIVSKLLWRKHPLKGPLLVAHPTSSTLMQKSKYLTEYLHAVVQVCLIARSVWKSTRVIPTYSCNCWQSGASIVYCTIRWKQRWATYTDVISEGEHIRTRLSHVNILTLSLRQINTFHISFFLPYGTGGLSSSHKQTFLCIPASPSSRCVCSF